MAALFLFHTEVIKLDVAHLSLRTESVPEYANVLRGIRVIWGNLMKSRKFLSLLRDLTILLILIVADSIFRIEPIDHATRVF